MLKATRRQKNQANHPGRVFIGQNLRYKKFMGSGGWILPCRATAQATTKILPNLKKDRTKCLCRPSISRIRESLVLPDSRHYSVDNRWPKTVLYGEGSRCANPQALPLRPCVPINCALFSPCWA